MTRPRLVNSHHRAAIQSTRDLRERIDLPKRSIWRGQIKLSPTMHEVVSVILCTAFAVWYGWVLGGMR